MTGKMEDRENEQTKKKINEDMADFGLIKEPLDKKMWKESLYALMNFFC